MKHAHKEPGRPEIFIKVQNPSQVSEGFFRFADKST
jgi:hypothetical protein